MNPTLIASFILLLTTSWCGCSPMIKKGESHAKKLYDDKLKKSGYSKLIRPVGNTSDSLEVRVGLRLTSIIDVDEKNQIMQTNVWLEQSWSDFRLTWDPLEYGGVETLYVPPDEIWLPDIVLYNSADGNFTVKLVTKATIDHTGYISWKPPAIYKSLCPINVQFFPFDEQTCMLKIGSWTYDGYSVNILHRELSNYADPLSIVKQGINLDDYAESTEWDLLDVQAQKYLNYYPCCSEPYADIKFNITMRRKTLFYTVNLLIPCVAICTATLLVFYMPAASGEKITMGITILNSLNIFLLLVAEINPPTSLATPLIGKYLLFTMVLVTFSIMFTVFVLNIHWRSPSTHTMSPWVEELFLRVLPRLLFMQRPQDKLQKAVNNFSKTSSTRSHDSGGSNAAVRSLDILSGATSGDHDNSDAEQIMTAIRRPSILPSNVMHAVIGVSFIADHLKQQDADNKVKQDWQFVAMVLDRLLLWLFTAVCLVGTFGIIMQAPTLYDTRPQIGVASAV